MPHHISAGTCDRPDGAAIPGLQLPVNSADGPGGCGDECSGRVLAAASPPGTYTITATALGFGKFTTTAALLVAQPATVNMKLPVSVDVTSVDVSAATETINTTDATMGDAINNETIMQLPSEGRNPQTLLALPLGVLFSEAAQPGGKRRGTVR